MKRPYSQELVKGKPLTSSIQLKDREILTGRVISINEVKYLKSGEWKNFMELKLLGTDGMLYIISGGYSLDKELKKLSGVENLPENIIQIARVGKKTNGNGNETDNYFVRIVNPVLYTEEKQGLPPVQPQHPQQQYQQPQRQQHPDYPPVQPQRQYQESIYDNEIPF